ncbi:spermidine synthase [Alicyclobacillus dauci]|uniref:Spermidine synthase n=1 Tax=Alicyclobacillus dauci TaxID=1475485 RepID=A0ABY6Z9Y3_9BACL|nr:spermidine synthase [Alicyclobacillus dauci]WAH39066.1 spermidine synthase [Alicyclobacillus dauci]
MMRFGKRGGWQGALDATRPDRPVFPYQRAFRALAYALPKVEYFLSIGVGTGTAMHSVLTEHPNAALSGIEIDERVLEVAIHYFQAPNHHRADYWVGDGFAFIRTNRSIRYDLIFIDAYMPTSIYQPALEPYVLDALLGRLTDGGVAVYNIIGQSMRSRAKGRFTKAAKERFSTVLDLPVGLPFSDQNHLVILSNDNSLFERFQGRLGRAPSLSVLEHVWWPIRLRKL